jgi:hypothetical protein
MSPVKSVAEVKELRVEGHHRPCTNVMGGVYKDSEHTSDTKKRAAGRPS